MRIIHIIDSSDKINFGIWNTILTNAESFALKDIQTEIWFPGELKADAPFVTKVTLDSTAVSHLALLIKERKLDVSNDVIFSHGAWAFPTRWAASLQQKGFRWMYIPHGMLEPWPMRQKWLKKKIYFSLFEKRLAAKADWIRAVSMPEKENLQILFPRQKIEFVPNGIDTKHCKVEIIKAGIIRYLFLSRLHPKKNIASLLEAWAVSSLAGKNDVELVIAGPDQGELSKVEEYAGRVSNIQYLGSVYGEAKNALFSSSAFYVLPSFSEGLPSALLEAMSYGLVPIVTADCNLPEVKTMALGETIGHDVASILKALEKTYNSNEEYGEERRLKCKTFVNEYFSTDHIADKLIGLVSKHSPYE